VFGDREGVGDEVGDLLEPFLNLKKLHGTPSSFESLHYIRGGQKLKVSSDKGSHTFAINRPRFPLASDWHIVNLANLPQFVHV
jgi:hypothetical protein